MCTGNKASAADVFQITSNTTRVLRLKYKNLKEAFNPKNHEQLNDLFSKLFFSTLVTACHASDIVDMNAVRTEHSHEFESHLPYPQILCLPEHLKELFQMNKQ